MLDYAFDVVIPAFTRDTFIRKYGDTSYHFYEVDLINLTESNEAPVLALVGRFVKDTILTRTQVFDDAEGLVKDKRSMRSAPSAFFVILLNNHRMIYFAETPHAPDLGAFRLTALDFLRRRWREIIDEKFDTQTDSKKVTKTRLRQIFPIPTLEVIPLTDRSNIGTFVRRYETLKRIDFKLVRPNDEVDAAETLDRVRKFGIGLNSTQTKLTASNNHGLDQAASITAVTEATETGNQEIQLYGLDENGNTLKGNNQSFELSVPVESPPNSPDSLAKALFKIYKNLSDTAAINAPSLNKSLDKIKQLMGLL